MKKITLRWLGQIGVEWKNSNYDVGLEISLMSSSVTNEIKIN